MLSLYRFYHARISIPFTGKLLRVFLPFFSKMFVEDSSQQNADRQRRNCNLSIFDPGREKKIKLDNWSETVLLTFFFPSAEGNTIQDKFHSHSRDTGKQWQVHCGCSWL